MTLLPMNGFPFYPIGWSLQHEMIFYVMAAAIIPFFGISALVAILLVSYIAFQTIDMPWYVATLANHHGEFLAGLLAFLTYKRLAWLGATLPVAVGFVALLSLAYFERSQLFPFPLYVVIVGFANWRSQSSFLALAGDASYSIYLIHPIIFMAASAIVSKIPFAIWAQEPIRFGCISVVVLTSIASWKWFEIPILEFAGRIRNAKLAELPTK
jgi:peptidoglycan/LPS O-acetylase OafA/YrhL